MIEENLSLFVGIAIGILIVTTPISIITIVNHFKERHSQPSVSQESKN